MPVSSKSAQLSEAKLGKPETLPVDSAVLRLWPEELDFTLVWPSLREHPASPPNYMFSIKIELFIKTNSTEGHQLELLITVL